MPILLLILSILLVSPAQAQRKDVGTALNDLFDAVVDSVPMPRFFRRPLEDDLDDYEEYRYRERREPVSPPSAPPSPPIAAPIAPRPETSRREGQAFHAVAVQWTACLEQAEKTVSRPVTNMGGAINQVLTQCRHFEAQGVTALVQDGMSPANAAGRMRQLVGGAKRIIGDDLSKKS